MTRFSPWICVLFATLAVSGLAATESLANEDVPWGLRDHYFFFFHYSFTFDQGTFLYAVQTAEIAIQFAGLEKPTDEFSFAIHLTDESTLTPADFTSQFTDRQRVAAPPDAGTRYRILLNSIKGISIQHSTIAYDSQPYFLIEMTLRNTSDAPIDIASVDLLALGPDGLPGISPEAVAVERPVAIRGPYPVFDNDSPSVFGALSDKTRNVLLGIGVLPSGAGQPAVALEIKDGTLRCRVSTDLTPGCRIEPGADLTLDSVWLAYACKSAGQMDMHYAWAFSQLYAPKPRADLPRWWVTIPEEGSCADLSAAVAAWAGMGKSWVLVPASWEDRPGAMRGAAPAWPRDIGSVVGMLGGKGAKVGIAVDPLAVDEGDDPSTMRSEDGTVWANPGEPAGMARASARIAHLAQKGFAFFGVPPSRIPDGVLRAFHITRAQAGNLAYQAALKGAQGKPVLPASTGTVSPSLDGWLDAAAALAPFARFNVMLGPCRYNLHGLPSIAQPQETALALNPGIIELQGLPGSQTHQQASRILSGPPVACYPLDGWRRSPKLWQANAGSELQPVCGTAVLAFPGADPWGIADVDIPGGANGAALRLWDGKLIDLSAGQAPAADAYEVYVVAVAGGNPAVLGAWSRDGVPLSKPSNASWAAAEGRLSGSFPPAGSSGAFAAVSVPAPWVLKSAGGSRAGVVQQGRFVVFELSENNDIRFTCVFERGV